MNEQTEIRPGGRTRRHPLASRARTVAGALGMMLFGVFMLMLTGGELARCALLSSPWSRATTGIVVEKHYVSGRNEYFHNKLVYRYTDPAPGAPANPFFNCLLLGELVFQDLEMGSGAFTRSGRVDESTYDRLKPGVSIPLRYWPGAPWLARLDAEHLHGFDHFMRFLLYFFGALLSAVGVVAGTVNCGRYALGLLNPDFAPVSLGVESLRRVDDLVVNGLFGAMTVRRLSRPTRIGLATLFLVAGIYFFIIL